VKLISTTTQGKAIILRFAGSGDILGLSSVITGRSYDHRVETIPPAQIAFAAADEFVAFLKQNDDVLLRVPNI